MKKSFTLIELIVVIAIIAILAAIIAPNAFKAIEKAKISKAIAEIAVIKTAMLSYYVDTGQWPPVWDSYAGSRPINSLWVDDDGTGNAVPGWDGPYVAPYGPHPWGGLLNWACIDNNAWWDNKSGCWVLLNDDRPEASGGTSGLDNQGKVPAAAMLRIDEMIDDGNTLTGNARAKTNVEGEMSFIIAEF